MGVIRSTACMWRLEDGLVELVLAIPFACMARADPPSQALQRVLDTAGHSTSRQSVTKSACTTRKATLFSSSSTTSEV